MMYVPDHWDPDTSDDEATSTAGRDANVLTS